MRKETLFSAITTFVVSTSVGLALLVSPQTTAVAEMATVATSSIFTAVNASDLTISVYGATFNGAGKINGVFDDTASIGYSYDTNGGMRCGYAFTVCDLDGNEILAAVRSSKANYSVSQYVYYNGTYSWSSDATTLQTTTEKWASYETLPDLYEAHVNRFVFTLNGDDFVVQSGRYESGQPTGLYTIGNYTLTDEDAAALADGFVIGVRTLDGTKAYDVIPVYNDKRDVCIQQINGVDITETVAVEELTESISYDGEIVEEDVSIISLAYGAGLGAFEYSAQYTIGTFTGVSTEEVMYDTEDFSTKEPGTYSITVEKNNVSKAYNVIVKEPASIAISDLFITESWNNAVVDENGITFGNSTANFPSTVAFNGVFDGSAKFTYALTGTNGQAGFAFAVCDTQGNEIVTVVRSSIKNYDTSLYAYYNSTYSYSINGSATTTRTEKWDGYADLPTGANIGTNLTLAYEGSTFKVSHTGWGNGAMDNATYTIANFTLTESDKLALANGFMVKVRELVAENASDVIDFTGGAGIRMQFASVNDIAFTQNMLLDSVEESISYDGETDGTIALQYGKNLSTFTYIKNCTIDTWNISVREDITYTEDFSSKAAGEYPINIRVGNVEKSYTVIVKSPLSDYTLEMVKGASVRKGTTEEGYGLRFISKISKTDYEAINALVGDGKYYKSVSYGIVILPYDYIEKNGDLTVDQLYGDGAIYDWAVDGKYSGTKTRIINLTDLRMAYDEEVYQAYVAYGSITDIKEYNLKRDFVGRGYICYELSDGTVGYKLFDYFEKNIENNTRSIYEVAKALVEANVLDTDSATWFKENVLALSAYKVEYYTVDEEGVATLKESVTLYGLTGNNAFAPARAYDGFKFDKTYEGSVVSDTVNADGTTVLKFYFVKGGA